MKIEVLTINYNTPELVKQLFITINKNCFAPLTYTVVNNGPKKFKDDSGVINVIDYEKASYDFKKECILKNKLPIRNDRSIFGSAHHAFTIDSYIKNSDADYILLFDTDVIVKENFDDKIKFLIESQQPFYSCLTPEDISGSRFLRVAPHCCFINKKLFIEMNLKFLTLDRFLDITHYRSYDTGRGLLEDVSKMNLKFFKDNSFFQHLKGISWKKVEGKLK